MTGLNFTIVKKFKKTADLLIFSFYFVFGLIFFSKSGLKKKAQLFDSSIFL